MNYNERLKYGIDQGNFLMKEIDTVCLQKRIRKKYEYQWIPINEDKFRKKNQEDAIGIDYVIVISVAFFFICMVLLALLVILFDKAPI
tara:strand:+ start:853 stop:1116 length:264 start_codon:yes stop_codon:yes gene_type:complete